MKYIKDKNIVIGISGGIAAYKSAELLRLIQKQDANVRVVMTHNAGYFVGPLTFEALSGKPVYTNTFEKGGNTEIRHIQWAEETDAVIVAPATANIIGKIANGIADDALSTFLLAVTCPVLICPSMNTNMYEKISVQRNIEILKKDGYFIVEPASGELACGTSGQGRLPEPEEILDRLIYCLSPKDFKGKKILVTAGPTREHIDPVRYISNPSSGKMGYAIARAAEHRGADVTLVSGPVNLEPPVNITMVNTVSAKDMAKAVFDNMENCDIIIKTAAVSDYRPKEAAKQKIKKGMDEISLVLQKNEDILFELGKNKKNRVLIGFAAETENLEKNAKDKLARKNLDIIVGNLVGERSDEEDDEKSPVFGMDTNKVVFFFRNGDTEHLPLMEKDMVAHALLDRIADLDKG
ncbi:MAG: bifunctional phosphopantothenoylcysteine decarboxylase/phosphopantothenate--cysteine ligase CoaBC [Proteobacteria bacterium]|nr:bifunctional phosphopantothenoylcysteine decarboxylase/phosphopantothenate--cysteine ligase CoaBC [Pseudomonadota bacterium]MBU4037954.1 bifunctional phosphopantothenoylcysteine decarboxylase/phosphopantothenate--cysteine ligase CoaBC [Pseudomonadota bacterium]